MTKDEGSWKKMAEKKAVEEAEEGEVKITFTKLSDAVPVKYLKVAVHGQPKSGKTRFSLTWPEPIYVIATEPGLRPLMRLFPKKEIYFVDVYEPDYTGMFEVDSTKTLAKIDAAVRQIREMVLADPKSVGTVVVDSVTDVWKWVQGWMKAEILKLDKTARVRQQWDWQYANEKYQNIIMQLLSLPTHLVLTAQDKEQYSGPGAPSGLYDVRWQKQTGFWVDIVIGLVKVRDPASGRTDYNSIIEDARHMDADLNPIAGTTVENIDYNELVKVINRAEKKT